MLLWLIYGISIERIDVAGYKAEKLYLKLDKKLTLRAQRVVLPRSKAKPSFQRVDKTFDNIRYMLELFDEISLYNIEFSNNTVALFYADDLLYIRTKDYEIAGKLSRKNDDLFADVAMLYIRRLEMRLWGNVRYDYRRESLEVNGGFEADAIKGRFRALKRGDSITFAINSENAPRIDDFVRRLGLKPVIERWIVDNVRAKRYRLDYLKGMLRIENGTVRIDTASLLAQARADDAVVRFHPDVPAVKVKRLYVRFASHTLTFVPESATYLGRSLEATTVKIRHLGDGKRAVLVLNLHALSDIGEDVARILRAYRLDIPIRHDGKADRIALTLRIPLKKGKKNITYTLHVNPDKGTLHIGDMSVRLCGGGEVDASEGKVRFRNIGICEKWGKGSVAGEVDMRRKKATLDVFIARLRLGDIDAPLIAAADRSVHADIDYADGIEVRIPKLGIRIDKPKHRSMQITLDRLAALRAYLRHPLLHVEDGMLRIVSNGKGTWSFNGRLRKQRCIFYGKDGRCFVAVDIKGVYDHIRKYLSFKAFGGNVAYNGASHRLTIRHINVDLKHLLALFKTSSSAASAAGGTRLTIKGRDSKLRYERYLLVTDTYDIVLKPNGDIEAYGSLDGDVVKFSRKRGTFHIRAHRIKDAMLHPLIGFSGLKKGRYSLTLDGNLDKEMKGRIIVEGGILSDFAAYNNTLAFINAVPALATLSRPGFSKQGFEIEAGVVEYRLRRGEVLLKKVYLKGKTATIVGKGRIDLASGQLNVDLAVRTVKDFAKVVGNIPVVGYLLLGEDKSVTIGLNISGNIRQPKVQTSVAKDILTMPVRMLERLIASPAKLNAAPKLPQLPPQPETQKHQEPLEKDATLF